MTNQGFKINKEIQVLETGFLVTVSLSYEMPNNSLRDAHRQMITDGLLGKYAEESVGTFDEAKTLEAGATDEIATAVTNWIDNYNA